MTEKAIATTEPTPSPAQSANSIPATREERRYQAPPVDIYETADGLVVLADLPGVPPEGIDVSVDRGVLSIAGRADEQAQAAQAEEAYQEFRASDYFRQFRLADQLDPDHINAEIKQGVLRVFLPRREQAKPRKIAVNAC